MFLKTSIKISNLNFLIYQHQHNNKFFNHKNLKYNPIIKHHHISNTSSYKNENQLNSNKLQSNDNNLHQFQLINRRHIIILLSSLNLVLSNNFLSSSIASTLKDSNEKTYYDKQDGFSIEYPINWIIGEGETKSIDNSISTRRVIAWYPDDRKAEDINITLIITNTSPEYTQMGSFGDPISFGTNIVSSMDRGFTRKNPNDDVQRAFLIDAKNINGKYLIEYNLKRVGEDDMKRFISLVCIGFNGIYNRLYTLTAQFPDSEYEDYKDIINKSLMSFQLIKV